MDLGTIKMAAFLDELEKLEKEAGLWGTVANFARQGIGQLGRIGSSIKTRGVGKTLGGLKEYGKTFGYGQLAKDLAPAGAVLGAGALGTYGAYKGVQGILGGGGQR